MKKLKCEACGANLQIDANNEYATCPYCNLKYKLKQDVNLNFEVDDDIKESIKKGGNVLFKIGVGHFVIVGIIILFVFFMVFKVFNEIFTGISKFDVDNLIIDKENRNDSFDSKMFNSKYELYSGSQSKFFIDKLLDNVISNNRNGSDKIILVVYNETQTADVDEIITLKNNLLDKDYQVLLDYDDKGFVNKVTLED